MTGNLPLAGVVLNSDIVDSSAGGYPRHGELGRTAESLITEAILKSPVPDAWTRSSRGDGEVTVAPGSIPAAWLLGDFVDALYEGAVAYNRNKRREDKDDHRLRLRVGIAGGDVLIEEGVPRGGDALVVAARLQNSAAAREAMRLLPDAPIAVILADDVYQRVVPHGAKAFDRRQFREITVDVNGISTTAWLYLPRTYPPQITPSATPAPSSSPSPAATSRATAGSKYGISITNSDGIQVGDNNEQNNYRYGR
ncbi:RIP homotypic interaction motif-containing protein [Paractinoplanes maris]|uniref:RIP homotypic interaction motif-containing protein n=1 Tax=Paractinoplanes maris TaxID=1734446 RepID=UPI0020223E82|nr:RIP homotypic interaction motif-containing protein [Actinoplanes maris]